MRLERVEEHVLDGEAVGEVEQPSLDGRLQVERLPAQRRPDAVVDEPTATAADASCLIPMSTPT